MVTSRSASCPPTPRGVVTVSEASLSRGLLLCLERAKQVVEPAGTAAVAALVEHPRDFVPPVVVLLSGGNIDPLLSKVLRHGLRTPDIGRSFMQGLGGI